MGFDKEKHYIKIVDFYDKIANNLFITAQNNAFKQDLISSYIDLYEK
jgi:hypothetical protein